MIQLLMISVDLCMALWSLFCMLLICSKGKVRTAEGTAVIQDTREPAKLGVSFSYCEYCLPFV